MARSRIVEGEQPQAVETITATTPSSQQYYDNLLAGATIREAVAHGEAEEETNRANQLRSDYMTAIENGQSGLRTLLQRREPQYDAKKEERLRKAAIVQSFGDMAVALARGAGAYNKRSGAGYVPSSNPNSPLASINEINRMRELYRTNRKAWDDLMIGNEIRGIEARNEAAKAMATAAETSAERARARATAASTERGRIEQSQAEAMARAEENARNREARATENARNRANQQAIADTRAVNSGQNTTYTDEGYIYSQLHPTETVTSSVPEFGGRSYRTTTTVRPTTMTIAEQNAAGAYDAGVERVKALMAEGMPIEEAIEAVTTSMTTE